MQITASVANLEQESKEMLPAMSPSRYRHRVWEGLVQSSKVSNLGVYIEGCMMETWRGKKA